MRRLAAILSAHVLLACGRTSFVPPDAQVFESRHITLRADPGLLICPASLAYGDRFVEQTAAFLDVAPTRIEYVLGAWRDRTPCGELGALPSSDCALPDEHLVLSRSWMHQHEIAHIVAGRLGRAPSLLEEGVAEMLSVERAVDANRIVDRTFPIEAYLVSDRFEALNDGVERERAYDAMAAYMMFLVRAGHRGALIEWYRSTPYGSDRATIVDRFETLFGETLDTSLAAWRSSPPQRLQGTRLRAAECGEPTRPTVPDDDYGTDGRLACSGQGVTDTQAEMERFALTNRGLYSFHLTGEQRLRADVAGCSEQEPSYTVHSLPGEAAMRIGVMDAGPHWFMIQQPSRSSRPEAATPALRSWRLRREGAVAGGCEGIPTVTIPEGVRRAEFQAPPDVWPGTETFDGGVSLRSIAFQVTVPRRARVRVQSGNVDGLEYQPMTMRACVGACGSSSGCEFAYASTALVTFADTVLEPGVVITIELAAPVGGEDRAVWIDIDPP